MVATLATLAIGLLLGIGAVGLALRAADDRDGRGAGPLQGSLAADEGPTGPGPGSGEAAAGGQGEVAPQAVPDWVDDDAREESTSHERAHEPVPPAPETLVAHLEALLARDELQAVERLSVLVVDEAGRTLAAHQPDLTVTPASTTKLVTAAAALRLLGPDYRYVTRVHAAGTRSDGTLEGDLVVVGSGDPALASPVFMESLYPARPHTDFDQLAAAVEAAGITAVRGGVLGDARLFADEPVAEGWADRYFASLDTARASSLTVDAGRRLFERDEVLLAEVAHDPAVRAAEVFTELLEERGIEVRGEPDRGVLPPGAEELGRVRSPPLRELLAHVVQASDNQMADGVFRTLGAVAGAGTWAGSDSVVREALSTVDVDWAGAALRDGSGLSRKGLLSARMLVGLDLAMTDRDADEWRALLAVAGESGTLRGRLRGTPAQGQLLGKTGALRDARALVAQVSAPDDRRYHFAVMGSDLGGEGITVTRSLMDEIALLLTAAPPACWPDEVDEDGRCP